jgi:hypothetical protein
MPKEIIIWQKERSKKSLCWVRQLIRAHRIWLDHILFFFTLQKLYFKKI